MSGDTVLFCDAVGAWKVYRFASGFQFCSSVIGTTPLSSTVLMRKRPSGATSYCRRCAVVHAAAQDARRKEHHRCARCERGPSDGDRRRHHRARRVEVIQFLAVWPPDRMDAARGRHQLARSCPRGRARRAGRDKRPDVDLHPPRFVRHVGHPPVVRRERAIALAEGGLQEHRRRAIPHHRHDPEIEVVRRGRRSDRAGSDRPRTS